MSHNFPYTELNKENEKLYEQNVKLCKGNEKLCKENEKLCKENEKLFTQTRQQNNDRFQSVGASNILSNRKVRLWLLLDDYIVYLCSLHVCMSGA